MASKIPLLLLVWNRQEYTEMTLETIVNNTQYPYELHIVDNGSDPKTADWLKSWVNSHPSIIGSYKRNAENLGLSPPTQDFWTAMQERGEPWFGKIDNDIEFPDGWLGRLVEVMEKCPTVGVASVCHYARDFEREVVSGASPVTEVNGVQYQVRTHVGGCGYLLRAEAQKAVGDIPVNMGKVFGWTKYQNWLNGRGWETVYAYPYVSVAHLGEWTNQRIKNDEYEKYNQTIWNYRHPGRD